MTCVGWLLYPLCCNDLIHLLQSGVVSGDKQKPLVRVLSMSPAQPGDLVLAATS